MVFGVDFSVDKNDLFCGYMDQKWPQDLTEKTKLILQNAGVKRLEESKLNDAVFNLKGFALTLLKMKMEDQYASR